VTRSSSPADKVLVPGRARGTAVVLDEPLSFWGGFDAATGTVIEPRHPQRGTPLTGRILFMASGKGSSSSSSVLAEAIRLGTAPAAIVLSEPDPILVLGAVAANELYGMSIPMVVLPRRNVGRMTPGVEVEVSAEGDRPLVREIASGRPV